jgi:hypothetical protein
MEPIGNYLKNKCINDNLRGAATPHVALFTVNPNFATGVGGTEATGGGYVRKAPTFADPASTPGVTTSTGALEWTLGTDIASDTYLGFAVYDASSAGNFLFGKAFSSDRTLVVAGDKIRLAAGEIDFSLTDPA